MALVWPLQIPMTCKAVLVSLADQANDEGYCWPALATIAERTCMAVRSVQRAIKDLEQLGYLTVDRADGRHSKYVIHATPMTESHPRQSVTPDTQSSTHDRASGDPRQSVRGPLTESPPNRKEPSMNHQEPKTRERVETVTLEDVILAGCDRQAAKDWLAVRARKRAPLTPTAWVALQREAGKAGITIGDAVAKCAERSWQSLDAKWLVEAPRTPGRNDRSAAARTMFDDAPQREAIDV